MKHITLFESFDGLSRRQRNYQRKKAEFDALSDKEKRKKYDAKSIMRLLKKHYPNEKFQIKQQVWHDGSKTTHVFLPTHTSLLNSWNRDTFGKDGVETKFHEFLKANKLEHSWHSPKNATWWDGILIKPKDFEGFYMYSGISKEPTLKVGEKNYEEIKMLIKAFKDVAGLDVTEADNGFDYNDDSKDRYEFDTVIDGMTFRLNVMKSGPNRGESSYKEKILKNIRKIKESLRRHKASIKEVYDYCKTVADGPLWTLSGGGAQLQQFYGDDNGYMATLYLDMEDEDENKAEYARRDKTLVVNGSLNDPKFVNFKSKTGIEFRSHNSVFGDEYDD